MKCLVPLVLFKYFFIGIVGLKTLVELKTFSWVLARHNGWHDILRKWCLPFSRIQAGNSFSCVV
jgi:hypothetical protein